MKSCHQILSLRKICSNTQRIFPNGRNGTRQSWRGKHSSTPHIPFPNSFISLMLNLKQMRGECNKTWMLNRVTLIQSPAILEFFFQQFSNSNIALALKTRKNCPKKTWIYRPWHLFQRKQPRALSLYSTIGNPVNSLLRKKSIHCFLNIKPNSLKHNALISR